MNLYTKLNEVKKEIGAISKDSTNPFFKSKYFDINSLLRHVEPLLQKNGLLLLQPIYKGYVISQIIEIESGEKIQSALELPQIEDPQKIGSCVSYYRRYTLQSLISLQCEDDDANSASQATKSQKQWVNQNDKIWNAAVDKGVSLTELKKHYSISKINAELYPFK